MENWEFGNRLVIIYKFLYVYDYVLGLGFSGLSQISSQTFLDVLFDQESTLPGYFSVFLSSSSSLSTSSTHSFNTLLSSHDHISHPNTLKSENNDHKVSHNKIDGTSVPSPFIWFGGYDLRWDWLRLIDWE